MQFHDVGAVIYFVGLGAGTLLLLAGLLYGTWQRRLSREETGHALPGEDAPSGAGPGRGAGVAHALARAAEPTRDRRGRNLMIGGGILVVCALLIGALVPTTQKIDMDRPTTPDPTGDARPAQPTDPTAVGNSPVR
ncbi:MAG: hypothetical protein AB1592_18045 [Pseudomonadota bacterium]